MGKELGHEQANYSFFAMFYYGVQYVGNCNTGTCSTG